MPRSGPGSEREGERGRVGRADFPAQDIAIKARRPGRAVEWKPARLAEREEERRM